MSEFRFKEVYFDGYCHKCMFKDKDEAEEPCDDCLEQAMNEFSHKPVKFIPKEDK